jgi:hypothetical protein
MFEQQQVLARSVLEQRLLHRQRLPIRDATEPSDPEWGWFAERVRR